MISFNYKFIFIHIPKTGGTSVTAALKDYSSDEISFSKSEGRVVNEDGSQEVVIYNNTLQLSKRYYKHATLEDFFGVLQKELYSYYIFTVVRNPFDRVISQTSFVNGINTVPLKLQNFSMPKPQLDYVKLNDIVVVKNFIRYENLQKDFDKICLDIGLPTADLPHKNSSNRLDYRQYYTDSTKKMIYRMYQDEFEYFEYEF